MKFNWATGLTIFFILFVGMLAFILYKSRQYDHSLVIDNYYEEDINYQEKYDKLQNTADLANKLIVDYQSSQENIRIEFPSDSLSVISGKATLYNPISNKSDVNFDFDLRDATGYDIPLKDIASGRWKLKIDWKMGSKSYYQEEEIIIK